MPGLLLHPVSAIIRQLLINLGYGVLPSAGGLWPIFIDYEPSDPDDCITVYSTAGIDSGRVMIDGERQEHNGFQIRVRSAKSDEGFVKANAIAIALDKDSEMFALSVGSTPYLVAAITRTSDVIPLGKEVPLSKRSLFTINALVSVRQT